MMDGIAVAIILASGAIMYGLCKIAEALRAVRPTFVIYRDGCRHD